MPPDRARAAERDPDERFLLDVMCGGLTAYLRMCNYDTVYAGDRGLEADDELVAVAREDGRTLITRDVHLANRADDVLLLESRDVEDQLAELAAAGVALDLADEPAYCGRCNGPLERIADGSTPAYAPDPAETTVWRCRDCDQCFWRGSHWDRVARTLERVDADVRSATPKDDPRTLDDGSEGRNGSTGGDDPSVPPSEGSDGSNDPSETAEGPSDAPPEERR